MKEESSIFEIRFEGKSLTPEKVRLEDMLSVLSAVKDIFKSLAKDELGEESSKAFSLSCPQIRNKCLSIDFSESTFVPKGELHFPPQPSPLKLCSEAFIKEIRSGNYKKNDNPRKDKWEEMGKFSKRYECEGTIYREGKKSDVIINEGFTLTKPLFYKETTTFYGTIIRITGTKEKPSVTIERADKGYINCSCTEEEARKLAEKLYSMVAVRVDAKFNLQTKKIQECSIKEVLPFENVGIAEAMKKLREAIGNDYDDIDDVDEYVRKMREE